MPDKKNVRFLDLKKLYQRNREEYLSAIERVLDSAGFIGGTELQNFEREFATWIGRGFHVAGCGNGTDAITLAARALNFPEDSEAIIPAMTFVATAEGLIHAGLRVRLVDIDEETWVMDLRRTAAAITSSTKLLAPVHLYGQMAPMDTLRELADSSGCKILEDAAQAHGARWKDQPVGFWGDVATYSFFPGKNLGGFGDGGAVASRDASIVQQCWAFGKHGGKKKYEHEFVGCNSRLDAIQAAVLSVKLKYIDQWNAQRRVLARAYRELLSGIEGLVLPKEHDDALHVYHLFVVQIEDRTDFQKYLAQEGIETGVHYPLAIHQLPAFKEYEGARGSFPNAERLAACGISLPICPTMQLDDVEWTSEKIRAYFK